MIYRGHFRRDFFGKIYFLISLPPVATVDLYYEGHLLFTTSKLVLLK
jgi:hypothetical protein